MPTNALRILIAPALAVMAISPAHAEIYQWTDEEGVTHYTDQPREDGAEKEWARPDLTNSPMELPEPGTWEPEREPEKDDRGDHQAARERLSEQERDCRQYEKRLDRINEELGQGYREPRGNRLRAERRELRSTIFSEC